MTMSGMSGPIIDEFLQNVTSVMKTTDQWGSLAGKDEVKDNNEFTCSKI